MGMGFYAGSLADIGNQAARDTESGRDLAAKQAQALAMVHAAQIGADANRYGADRSVDIARTQGDTAKYATDASKNIAAMQDQTERFRESLHHAALADQYLHETAMENLRAQNLVQGWKAQAAIEADKVKQLQSLGAFPPAIPQVAEAATAANANAIQANAAAEQAANMEAAQHEYRMKTTSAAGPFGHIIGTGFGGETTADPAEKGRFNFTAGNDGTQNSARGILIGKMQAQVSQSSGGKVSVQPVVDDKGTIIGLKYVPVKAPLMDLRGNQVGAVPPAVAAAITAAGGQGQPAGAAPQAAPPAAASPYGAPVAAPAVNPGANQSALAGQVLGAAMTNPSLVGQGVVAPAGAQEAPPAGLVAAVSKGNPRAVIPPEVADEIAKQQAMLEQALKDPRVDADKAMSRFQKVKAKLLEDAANVGKSKP